MDGWKVGENVLAGQIVEIPAPNPVLATLGVDPTSVVGTSVGPVTSNPSEQQISQLQSDVALIKAKLGM